MSKDYSKTTLVVGAKDSPLSSALYRCMNNYNCDFLYVTKDNYEETVCELAGISVANLIWCSGLSSKSYCNNNNSYCWELNVDDLMRCIGDFEFNKLLYISDYDVYPSIWNWKDKVETSNIDPSLLTYYGKTKLEGESLVKKYCNNYLIIRANKFSGVEFKYSVINNLRANKSLNVGMYSLLQYIHTDIFFKVITYLLEKNNNDIINVSSFDYMTIDDILLRLELSMLEINQVSSYNRIAVLNTHKLRTLIPRNWWKYLSCNIAVHFSDKPYYIN